MHKLIPGNHNYAISLEGDILKADGSESDLPVSNDKVTLLIYDKVMTYDVEWLGLLAHFELDLPDHLDKVYFVDSVKGFLKSRSGKVVRFTKPILVSDRFRIIPGYVRYAVDRSGKVLDLQLGRQVSHETSSLYLMVNIYDPELGRKRRVQLHRLVALAWIQNSDFVGKPIINHKDGNKFNTNVNNLEWCSFSDNNRHAIESGLRSDNRKYKVRDEETGEIKIYHSFRNICLDLGLADTVKFKDVTSSDRPRLIKGRYQVKELEDESPWANVSEINEKKNRYTITVKMPDGHSRLYTKTSELCKELGIWNVGCNIVNVIQKAKTKYPGIDFNVIENFGPKPVQAYEIETGTITSADTVIQLSKLLKIGSSTIGVALKLGETHNCKGYAFRFKSDKPWDTAFKISPYKPICVKATNVFTSESLTFPSVNSAVEHFGSSHVIIRKKIEQRGVYRNWRLERT